MSWVAPKYSGFFVCLNSAFVIPQLSLYPDPFKSSLSTGELQHVHVVLILFV